MLTVSISINGVTIFSRTAVRRLLIPLIVGDRKYPYLTDTGELVFHGPKEGCVVLAKLLLNTIKEQLEEHDPSKPL